LELDYLQTHALPDEVLSVLYIARVGLEPDEADARAFIDNMLSVLYIARVGLEPTSMPCFQRPTANPCTDAAPPRRGSERPVLSRHRRRLAEGASEQLFEPT